jgi:hypothetical protein
MDTWAVAPSAAEGLTVVAIVAVVDDIDAETGRLGYLLRAEMEHIVIAVANLCLYGGPAGEVNV